MTPQTTRWSLIARAADPGRPDAGSALEELFSIWRPAVLTFLRSRTCAADADDLTQSFFLYFIEAGLSARADPERGRFRSFVFSALKRWWIDQRRAETALKRGGSGAPAEPLDEQLLESGDQPEAAFDRAWAVCLLRESLRRLEQEAERNGRRRLFEAAQPYLLEAPEAGDYSAQASALGISNNAFAVAVGRLRKRLQAIVRNMVADTLFDSATVDSELRLLRGASDTV